MTKTVYGKGTKLTPTANGWEYKGYEIIKTWKHGYTYWKIHGEKETYSTRSDAMRIIDSRTKEAE